MPKPLVNCIYCALNKCGSREHVLQDGLGGVDVLTNVCEDCNRLLRANDRVLVSESVLAMLVARELCGVGPNSWDVDYTRNELLLEVRQTPDTDSMTLVPQLIFDGDEQLIYCDVDEIATLGQTEAQNRFHTRLHRAFGHYRIYGPNARKRDHKGQDMLKLSPVDRVRSAYRLPARISCNLSLREFGSEAIMFNLRYLDRTDRDRVLDALSKMNWSKRVKKSRIQLGSELPEVRIQFCLTHAIQALTKVGYNLLAFFCKSTPVNRTSFQSTVEWIMEGKHATEFGDIRQFGFIDPGAVVDLRCPPKSHKFRMAHDASCTFREL